MEAPKIPGFFKSKGPKSFQFTARYYDERKERIQKRRVQLKRELEAEEKIKDRSEADRREEFSAQWRSRSYRKASSKSSFRFVIILGFLVVLFVWLWNQMGGLL